MTGPEVTAEQVGLLRSGRSQDPHSILGLHRRGEAGMALVWRPGVAGLRGVVGEEVFPFRQLEEDPEFQLATLTPRQMSAAEELARSGMPPFLLEQESAGQTESVPADPYSLSPTLGPQDLHLLAEGTDRYLYRHLGANFRTHQGVPGTAFAVWAPNALGVRLVGPFCGWDSPTLPMRNLGAAGIWEIFVPGVEAGTLYKFWILRADGSWVYKADPVGRRMEVPPRTASVVAAPLVPAGPEWRLARDAGEPLSSPISVYEVHLNSWRRREDGSPLTYRELGEELGAYARELGFTHVELMPVAEHPYGGSWGYQVSGYYAPTARFGSPQDFLDMVNSLHQAGVGVILDWVPAHFPRDDFALNRFDGTALYEHQDPRLGVHPDWGTAIFNFGRREVRNFLVANALYWLDEFDVDGLRVDAVASMLYLDYSRKPGEWVPNRFGGRENLDAVEFLREVNVAVYGEHPGALMIAEESTAWPGVSRPVYTGGLGFGLKWNLGWMHDTLDYFSRDPIHRRYHHNALTFSLMYAFSENFLLPLSHDEVVHGKGSLLSRMPGDDWRKFANLRALYGYMWAHPGKQLLFMGSEFGQRREWDSDSSLDWQLLDRPEHLGVQRLVRDLNRIYRAQPSLHELDFDQRGFRWIDGSNADANVIGFARFAEDPGRHLVCLCNLSPVPRFGYRVGLPTPGPYREVLNTDSRHYGGSDVGNLGVVESGPTPWHGLPNSATVTLPPLATVWLAPGLRPD